MTRLGVLILVLMLTSAVLVGGVMLYGRARSKLTTLNKLGFNMCDDKPCWRGIVPGVTDWDTAKTFMMSIGGVEYHFPDYESIRIFHVSDLDAGIGISRLNGEQLVTWIDMAFPPLPRVPSIPVSLGEVLMLYGPPCVVVQGSTEETMYLASPVAQIVTNFSHGRVNLEDSINQLSIEGRYAKIGTLQLDPCQSDLKHRVFVTPWRGLTSIHSYYLQILQAAER